MNFYKRHLGDVAKSCGHLSQGRMGAYDLLMDWMYGNEKLLPLDIELLYMIGRATTKAERDNVDFVIRDLFTKTPDGYTHGRVAEEITKANEQAEINRAIAVRREAAKRARTEHESCNEPCTNRQPSQTPDSISQEKAKARARSPNGSRLPAEWELPPDWLQWARTERPELDAITEAAKFADYWHGVAGAKGRKADWLATWRNWIRNASPPRNGSGNGHTQPAPAHNPGGVSPKITGDEAKRREREALALMQQQLGELGHV